MLNHIQRPGLRRAGSGAIVVALVAVVGYGIGQSHASSASVSAATPAAVAAAIPVTGQATSYAAVVDQVTPAVVTIHVEKKAAMVPTQFQLPDDPLFRQFFGREFQGPRQQRVPRQGALGSGVLTTPDGYILTNNHVIDGADSVRVELSDQRSFDAKVVGADPASDLAVLKIDAQDLPTISIGDSSHVRVGDVVLAVGNPLGVGQTVTMGIISAKGRATGVGDGSYEDFLQTDAPINQGNSGGALVNLNGELVGINSQILTPTGGNIGLGFAIPSNMAREVMDQLKTSGIVRRGRLGVMVQNVTADIASSLQLPDASGALVSGVEPDSPAARAGIEQGDVITAVNGEDLSDSNALRNRIAGTRPGSSVTLDIMRDGHAKTLKANLAELEASHEQASTTDENASEHQFGATGMSVEPLTPETARELGIAGKTGLVVRDVDPDGVAAASGVRPGDIITRVNGEAVSTPGQLRSALNASGDRPALMLVTRENASIFLALRQPHS